MYLDRPKWTYRTYSTDSAYVREILPRLQNQHPELEIAGQESNYSALLENVQLVGKAAKRRFVKLQSSPNWIRKIRTSDPGLHGSDFIYNNHDFPINSKLPVVWQNTIVDPHMRVAKGASSAQLQHEIERKRPLFQSARAVIVSTDSERRRLVDLFPSIEDKIYSIPFYLPDIKAPEEILRKHEAPDRVRILFVGNPAKLKRLHLLVEALNMLPAELRSRIELIVVSRFTDGLVSARGSFPIKVFNGLANWQVQEEMRKAHILVNPSLYESFGFVFIEAMAAGAVAVGPSWEAQREIFKEGDSGVLLPPKTEAVSLRTVMIDLIENDDMRLALAELAHKRFQSKYSSTTVGPQLLEVFYKVSGQSTA